VCGRKTQKTIQDGGRLPFSKPLNRHIWATVRFDKVAHNALLIRTGIHNLEFQEIIGGGRPLL